MTADPAPPAPVPSVEELVAGLDLERHPEGGWFRRTWASEHVVDPATDRRAASAIHFLLGPGERSTWHRLTDAEELWVHRSGAPVALHLSPDGVTEHVVVLGPDVAAGHEPTVVVPVGHWQSAEPVPREGTTPAAGWSLVSCVVSPEFRFESFELAPPCWDPGGDQI